jgi:acyl carrier protein
MTASTAIADVTRAISHLLSVAPEHVTPDSVLSDLVTESFVLVELVIDLQEQFGVRFEHADLERLHTVADLAELVAARSAEGPR